MSSNGSWLIGQSLCAETAVQLFPVTSISLFRKTRDQGNRALPLTILCLRAALQIELRINTKTLDWVFGNYLNNEARFEAWEDGELWDIVRKDSETRGSLSLGSFTRQTKEDPIADLPELGNRS